MFLDLRTSWGWENVFFQPLVCEAWREGLPETSFEVVGRIRWAISGRPRRGDPARDDILDTIYGNLGRLSDYCPWRDQRWYSDDELQCIRDHLELLSGGVYQVGNESVGGARSDASSFETASEGSSYIEPRTAFGSRKRVYGFSEEDWCSST